MAIRLFHPVEFPVGDVFPLVGVGDPDMVFPGNNGGIGELSRLRFQIAEPVPVFAVIPGDGNENGRTEAKVPADGIIDQQQAVVQAGQVDSAVVVGQRGGIGFAPGFSLIPGVGPIDLSLVAAQQGMDTGGSFLMRSAQDLVSEVLQRSVINL